MTGGPDPDLVTASRILVAEGVLDAFGHVSMRDTADPEHFWLSSARPPSTVERADFMRFDLDAEPIEPTTAPQFAERVLHAAIYAARPEVGAVCHHHAPGLLPFCLGAGALYPVSQTGGFLGGPVPMWDSADEFGATNMLVTTMEQARSLARAMGERPVALMRGHGVMVAARGLRELTFMAIYSAREAERFLQTAALARPLPLSEGEIELSRNLAPAAIQRGWEHWVGALGKGGDA